MLYKLFFLCIFGLTNAQEQCSKSCIDSYPLHTEDKVLELQACTKGCRLQFISYLTGKNEACSADCTLAYQKSKSEISACELGCKEQARLNKQPSLIQAEDTDSVTLHIRLLHPMLVMKTYCYNMFNNAASYVRGSTYVVERSSTDEHGNSVFMHFEMFPAQDVTEDENQKVVEEETRQFNTASGKFKHYFHKLHGHASNWLNCVEGRAGIPYATLVAVLFLSLAMVGWICCSTCDESDNEEESQQQVHTFSKGGLSIKADEFSKSGRVFTIVAAAQDNDDAEKLLLA